MCVVVFLCGVTNLMAISRIDFRALREVYVDAVGTEMPVRQSSHHDATTYFLNAIVSASFCEAERAKVAFPLDPFLRYIFLWRQINCLALASATALILHCRSLARMQLFGCAQFRLFCGNSEFEIPEHRKLFCPVPPELGVLWQVEHKWLASTTIL